MYFGNCSGDVLHGFLLKDKEYFFYIMNSPFGAAAAASGTNPPVAAVTMSSSGKLMMVLSFATVFSIFLIAIFVMNIMWARASSEEDAEVSEEEKKSSGTKKGAAFRNYIGVGVSSIMLITLMPGFYFANSM